MTSPSTLIRKAAKAKSAATAARLRAEAAKLRREARQLRTTAGTLRAEAGKLRKTAVAKAEALATKVRSRINEVATRTLDMQPQSEVSGGWKAVSHDGENVLIGDEYLETLRAAARKKPKSSKEEHDSFGIAMRAALVTQRAHGRRQVEESEREKRKAIYDANRIAVVSGFIATVEAAARHNKGELAPTVVTSGYTIARIIEALRLAGYTENGKGAPRRD